VIAVERSLTIPAPVEQVWSVLAGFDDLASWAANVDHSCWLDDERFDGEMIGRARRVQAGRMALVERITVWDPPARLAYELVGLPPVVRSAVNEWRLDPDRSTRSRTLVTLTSHVDCGPRPPQQLVARIVGRRLAGASDTMLAGLAAELAEPSADPSTVTFDPAPRNGSDDTKGTSS
jgi:uncharacterized protein YndB with AHSA1/START domain